jgi:hypothetical protein
LKKQQFQPFRLADNETAQAVSFGNPFRLVMQKTTFAIDEAEDDPTASLSSLDGGDSPKVRATDENLLLK